jgi:ParB-like nuclease domain
MSMSHRAAPRKHPAAMTAADYQDALERLGLNHIAAARILDCDPETSRLYARGARKIPREVAELLKRELEMRAGKIPLPDDSKRYVSVDAIMADERAQPRAALLGDQVAEYAEEMRCGDKFPPITVFQDDLQQYWLADGFHRYHAAVGLGLKAIECDVHQGDLRDAILFSCGANAVHGVRRSNADKREAVTKLLGDPEWAAWSDSEIGRRCRVSHVFVAKMRERLTESHHETFQDEKPRTVRRRGTTYTQNIGKIGNSRKAEAPRVEVKTDLVTAPASARAATKTGIAAVQAPGAVPAPPSPCSKPADLKVAAADNIARRLGDFVEITDDTTPEMFLGTGGGYTPARLNRIVDDARLVIQWLTTFVKLAHPLADENPSADPQHLAGEKQGEAEKTDRCVIDKLIAKFGIDPIRATHAVLFEGDRFDYRCRALEIAMAAHQQQAVVQSIVESTAEPEVREAAGADPTTSPTKTPKTMESTSVSSTQTDADPFGIPRFLDRKRGARG